MTTQAPSGYDAFLAAALHVSLDEAQALHALHTGRELRARYSEPAPAMRVPVAPARPSEAPAPAWAVTYVPPEGAPVRVDAPRPAPVVCGVRLGQFPLRVSSW